MEQMAASHTASHAYSEGPFAVRVQTMAAQSADVSRDDTLDWPTLSPETTRWMVVVVGGVFAAAVGALLGGAMSL